MTEAELTSQVVATAHDLGFMVVHWRPAQTVRGWRTPLQGDAGWPDLTLARTGRLIVAELKQDGKDPTAEQWAWLELLATVPEVEAHVWRPADWRSNTITQTLLGRQVAA